MKRVVKKPHFHAATRLSNINRSWPIILHIQLKLIHARTYVNLTIVNICFNE